MNHTDKKNPSRIEWRPVNSLPSNRRIVCVIRNVYDRAISAYIHITHRIKNNTSIRSLGPEVRTNIYNNPGGVLQGFKCYLREIIDHGHFDDHSLPQVDFLNNQIRKRYKKYPMMSDRDINKVTDFIDQKSLNTEFKHRFNIETPITNKSKDHGLNQLLKKHLELYRKGIEEIYRLDLENAHIKAITPWPNAN